MLPQFISFHMVTIDRIDIERWGRAGLRGLATPFSIVTGLDRAPVLGDGRVAKGALGLCPFMGEGTREITIGVVTRAMGPPLGPPGAPGTRAGVTSGGDPVRWEMSLHRDLGFLG